jgi:hypothetical protein
MENGVYQKVRKLHSISLLHGTSKQGYNGSPEKASWGVIEKPRRGSVLRENVDRPEQRAERRRDRNAIPDVSKT